MDKKVLLIILDGWGIAKDKNVSAIDRAQTPFMDSLKEKYPFTTLDASGLAVGLPDGQMGNSEVGHMNLGAGRVVYQNLVKISLAAKDGSLAKNPVLTEAFEYAKKNGKKVHFIGLLSDGGVHSHIDHLAGLLDAAKGYGLDKVFVHAFMDGRDCDPKSGRGFVGQLEGIMEKSTGKLATIIGRYYAMDRDNRWERVKVAYDAMVNGTGDTTATDPVKAVEDSYAADVTDEFIKPVIMTSQDGTPIAKIEDGDVVINFNFRSDRGREITAVLSRGRQAGSRNEKTRPEIHNHDQIRRQVQRRGHTVRQRRPYRNARRTGIQSRQKTDTHSRNGKIPARYVLFLRRTRSGIPRRKTHTLPFSESSHLRSETGDERRRDTR